MKYHKVLIKFSGEAFGSKDKSFDLSKVNLLVEEIKQLKKSGLQIAIVCGGGNVGRGRDARKGDRIEVDFRGMKGTLNNAALLDRLLRKSKIPVSLYTSFSVRSKYPKFDYLRVIRDWDAGKIIILAGGTGYPFFSTDTSSVLFSLILGCDQFIKATKVSGVYSADPLKFPKAKKFTRISAQKYIKLNLAVVDRTAVSLAKENSLPIRVISWQPQNLVKLIKGQNLGSQIK